MDIWRRSERYSNKTETPQITRKFTSYKWRHQSHKDNKTKRGRINVRESRTGNGDSLKRSVTRERSKREVVFCLSCLIFKLHFEIMAQLDKIADNVVKKADTKEVCLDFKWFWRGPVMSGYYLMSDSRYWCSGNVSIYLRLYSIF